MSEDPVTVLSEQENYFLIQTSEGKQGWISKQYIKSGTPKSKIIENLRDQLERLQSGKPSVVNQPENTDSEPDQELLDQLARVQAEREILAVELARLEDSQGQAGVDALISTKIAAEELQTRYDSLLAEKTSLEDGHQRDIAARQVIVDSLKNEIAGFSQEIATLKDQNRRLARRQNIYWFVAGALVFIAGIFAGKIQGRRKKRYSL